ncbi:hypothetical protein WJX84_005911 [Apatococcus fuscideae]|uniref:GHMP kinase C-terminal domain-containing protein n=1 Tax=Apatococcus fuscideae TaxID=2026836 RepID=A0AAW1S6H1_9CHLO
MAPVLLGRALQAGWSSRPGLPSNSKQAPSLKTCVRLGGGYLCNITPSQFAQLHESHLPASMTGADFLSLSQHEHWDEATQVVPEQQYPVAAATAHPIFENFRVRTMQQLLSHAGSDPEALVQAGELMFQSHASYGRCGLGSEGTDRLVNLARDEMTNSQTSSSGPCIYGAKITGGGSGGAVCLLAQDSLAGQAAIERIRDKYHHQTGYKPDVFVGSSGGALRQGIVRLKLPG